MPGHYVRQWRLAAGLTQERLAEMTKLTHGAISQLERGVTRYTQDTIEKLADVFGCEPYELIAGPPSSKEQQEKTERLRTALPLFEQLSQARQDRILGQIEDAVAAEGLQSPPPALAEIVDQKER